MGARQWKAGVDGAFQFLPIDIAAVGNLIWTLEISTSVDACYCFVVIDPELAPLSAEKATAHTSLLLEEASHEAQRSACSEVVSRAMGEVTLRARWVLLSDD